MTRKIVDHACRWIATLCFVLWAGSLDSLSVDNIGLLPLSALFAGIAVIAVLVVMGLNAEKTEAQPRKDSSQRTKRGWQND